MDNRLPIVSAGSEVCLQQPVERRAWRYTQRWNTPPNIPALLQQFNTRQTPAYATIHTATLRLTHTHKNKKTYAHTIAKKAKKEKITNFPAKSLTCCCCHMFLSESQTVTRSPRPLRLSGASLHNGDCCNFSTAYCEPGRSPLLFSEWGRKQMQFFFKEKKILTWDYGKKKNKQNTLLIHGIVYKKNCGKLKSEERSINGTSNEIFSAF